MGDAALHADAVVFSALGDQTRLQIVDRLGDQGSASITRLTDGLGVTRQAVSKHLRVLEGAGLVEGRRRGRETRWQLRPDALTDAKARLERVSRNWDDALSRLKSFVE